MVRVLVTASRRRLAALLEKGLQLQGWTTAVANNYGAVVDAIRQAPTDLVLVDADFFQGDTSSLVLCIRQKHLPLILLAEDYQIGGYDLRKMATPEDIFIKPFSTQYLMTVLVQKLALDGCPLTHC
jgi:DNA-binding response OmpR family regulator